MSVVLPAPFSPRRARISPSSTTRSIESLAVSAPNRLVRPLSSSFTAPGGLRLRLRRDRDVAVLDLLLQGLDLRLQVRRDLAVEVVVGRQPDATVVERADVGL